MSVAVKPGWTCKARLDVQANIADLEGRVLADVDVDELGRVLVEDVDMPQAEQQQFLRKGRRQTREAKGHGGMPWRGLQVGGRRSRVPTGSSTAAPWVMLRAQFVRAGRRDADVVIARVRA